VKLLHIHIAVVGVDARRQVDIQHHILDGRRGIGNAAASSGPADPYDPWIHVVHTDD
jgi:hypothetical protein